MFETLLSNNKIKKELTRAITSGRAMHAYLFCGAEGSGKKTLANLIAKELVGKNKEKADRGSHPDIITLAPAKDKKTISVKQVRDMRTDAFVNPSEGLRKIYIIDGVHLMGTEGQNALLTVLEQPPSFVTFILLSESREKVLPTVISRCAVYDMEYVEPEDGARFLQKRLPSVTFENLLGAMHVSGGNIGYAQKLLSGDGLDRFIGLCADVSLSMAAKDSYRLAKLITVMTKENLSEFLPILGIYLKDLSVYKTAGESRVIFKESILQNRSVFDKIDINVLYDGVRECENALALINANVSVQLITAALVIRLCGGKQID